jgi:glycosyltransferase involved in cell wall biosynthesis
MRRLAIIGNDPIDLYLSSGYGADWLRNYFNPAGFFDEVYSLAPYEHVNGALVGVIALPTPVEELPRRLCDLQIDVVRAYGGAHPCAIACSGKTSHIPVVVSVHDALPNLLDRSIEDADVVWCVSETVKQLVSSSFKRGDRIWLLPNRVDFDVMRPDPTGDFADLTRKYPFKYKIMHVGRKVPEKNLDNLIRSLRVLGPEYCLLAVGKGPIAPYAQLASEEGVADRCFFIDAIPNDQLARYYSWADCSVTPSRTEAFAMVVAEALASGAMVIASDIPALRELIVHGQNGLLITDYENPAAIAAVVRAACTDQHLRGVAMANARRSVESFERSRIDALEASYYQKVLDLRAAGAFRIPLRQRIHRAIGQRGRRVLLTQVKRTLKPLINRYRQVA